ncbi:MAG: hypothetical protein ACOWWR_08520 [Eubacteriales bacterium]
MMKIKKLILGGICVGETCEYDWGSVKLTIDGKLKVLQMAAFATAKGNYRYANLYYIQKMKIF